MGELVRLPLNGGEAGYAAGDGYLALPAGGRGPGVLVLHAWWGRTDFIHRVCDRLATAGFVALAPDLYGGPTAATIEQAQALADAYSVDAAARTANAALNLLRRHPALAADAAGIATLGFSLGASWAQQLASSRPDAVSRVVSFYGSGDADPAASRAGYLFHFAEDDPYESDEWIVPMLDGLRAAGRPVEVHHYPGTSHWFMEDDQPAFATDAAELAWQRTLAFLG